jgi:hypothetical protein
MTFTEMYKGFLTLRNYRKATSSEPELTGLSFKYKTVQFHIIDDTFEEIKKRSEFFGDVKIYSERFSLPGFGVRNDILDGEEFQFEIIVGIDSKTDRETYLAKLKEVFDNIETRHGVDVLGEPYKKAGDDGSSEEYYNLHRIIFYTTREDVFPKE